MAPAPVLDGVVVLDGVEELEVDVAERLEVLLPAVVLA